MPTYGGGRHEHGQNFLTDRTTLTRIGNLVAETHGPIIEIGPGRGNLTRRLQRLGRPLTVVEIDSALVASLRKTLDPEVSVISADFLSWRQPTTPHVIVGNLPFHLTTATLRKLLHVPTWTRAILLVQWEVARRRTGVGGASMMTAQWWPWIDFSLEGRVPRSAFRPAPNVDGGLLVMTPRTRPLIPAGDRNPYRQFVHDVFTAKGRGLAAMLANTSGTSDRRLVQRWITDAGVQGTALPKDLSAEQWAQLFTNARPTRAPRRTRERVPRPTGSRSRNGI